MYLIIAKAVEHIEENNGNKYLVSDSAELHSKELNSSGENKEVFKNTKNFGKGLKIKLRT